MSNTLEKMARLYADEECTGNAMYGDGLYAGYLAGYRSRDEEVEQLKEEIAMLKADLREGFRDE
jgi:hypothetical protein